MRAALSLLAFAATTLGANLPRGYDKGKGKDKWETVVTEVIVTYTTVCPVTQTYTKPGGTYTTTFTTTSTVKTAVPTTIIVTQTAPPVTKTEGDIVYTTLTELCPVTETTVVSGSTVEIIWTSTSTIVTKVAQTETIYTTSIVTEYETTDVYETVTCPVVTQTTVIEGKTKKITKTNTITKAVTDIHTVTEIIPVTVTESVDVVVGVPVTTRQTVTGYSTVIVSQGNTIYTSEPLPPTTINIPTTITAGPEPTPSVVVPINGTSSAPPIVTAGANSQQAMAPLAAVVAGVLGAVALL
ncbi:hypothetical protein QBC38DRAFT_146980 [Podospora fimiseda]|uniref:Repetitive proline-rich cell wall protein n=1 Tax=Podospora fimiseda TaxID=252190 RepID=A0AAN7H2C1_9PEZI|nr:hypothetical protein QBC38DRAFT_146980 [Podospora fimiseda]